MDHGIIGSSDLDQGSGFLSKLTAKILALLFHHALKKGRLNPRIVHIFEKRAGKEYTRQFLRMMFGNGARKLNFVTRKSIERQYYSDLETKLEEEIEVEGSKVHCIYANKMGEEYKKRYLKHFKDPDIIEYDMLHEELLACRPKEWVQLMEQIVGGERV